MLKKIITASAVVLFLASLVSCGDSVTEENIISQSDAAAFKATGAALGEDIVTTSEEMVNAIIALKDEDFPYAELQTRYEAITNPFSEKFASLKVRFAELDNLSAEIACRKVLTDSDIQSILQGPTKVLPSVLTPKYMELLSESETEVRNMIYDGHYKFYHSIFED